MLPNVLNTQSGFAVCAFYRGTLALIFGVLMLGPIIADETIATTPARAAKQPATMVELIEGLAPAVVALEMERIEDYPSPALNPQRLQAMSEEDRKDLKDYFKRPPGPVSGLLLDREGHVLTTNYNLGKKVKNIRIVLSNGNSLSARLLARDTTDDLALIKTTEKIPDTIPVPTIKWASVESIKPGRFVLVVGRSPSPDNITTTFGIVSSPERNHGRLLQTDAALNYGNIGGPLVDLNGHIIGIAAFVGHIYPQWGFNSGIGFGVRADRIQKVLEIMKTGKDVPKPKIPFLGVGPAGNMNDPNKTGAAIGFVKEDSGAARGGVVRGDLIIEWDGTPIVDFMQLRRLIFKKKPGDEVAVKVKRGDSTVDLKIVLGEFSEPDPE